MIIYIYIYICSYIYLNNNMYNDNNNDDTLLGRARRSGAPADKSDLSE